MSKSALINIRFKHAGKDNTKQFLRKCAKSQSKGVVDANKAGELGVSLLAAATPVDTGKTAESWSYSVYRTSTGYDLVYGNSNLSKGWFPVAVMLDVGHGTKNGGLVVGRHYIAPTINPVLNYLVDKTWSEVID